MGLVASECLPTEEGGMVDLEVEVRVCEQQYNGSMGWI